MPMRFKTLCLVLAAQLVCVPLTQAWADTVANALKAVSKNDYDAAKATLLKAAQNGDVTVQSALGIMYFDGIGVARDYSKALPWLKKAADHGRPEAMYRLARAYGHLDLLERQNPPFNPSLSDTYFAQALKTATDLLPTADAGAQTTMGHLIKDMRAGNRLNLTIDLVKADQAYAQKLFLVSALRGDVDAEVSLGHSYDEDGTVEGIRQRLDWMSKAAKAGSSEAMFEVGQDLLVRQRDLQRARPWFVRAALLGQRQASDTLYLRYILVDHGIANLDAHAGTHKPIKTMAAASMISQEEQVIALIGLVVARTVVSQKYGSTISDADLEARRRWDDERQDDEMQETCRKYSDNSAWC